MPDDIRTTDDIESRRRLGYESYLTYQHTASSQKREKRERALITEALRNAKKSGGKSNA